MALSDDEKRIFVTPSVRYAGSGLLAESASFQDPVTNETLTARVVIQLFIKPGSYQVGPQTIGAASEIDPNISNQELEWSIKEPDSTRLFGLLIKLEEADNCQGKTDSEKHLRCEYQEKCQRFKNHLHLSDDFLDSSNDRCFCMKCHTAQGIKPNTKRGTPPKDYWLPIEWCRIGFKIGTHEEAIHLRHTWHIAFHGTRVQDVKAILEGCSPVIPGYKKDDKKAIFVSPSVRYAGSDTFTEPTSYEDPVTEKTLTAKAVIQLLIKPGSYQVGSQTIGAISAAIDPRFSNQELEWSIMGRDSTLLYGLLIKLDEADIYHGTAASKESQRCEYQEKCRRFKKLLQFSDDFFDSGKDKCFCPTCHASRRDKLRCIRKEPQKDYWLPIGWCRLGLRMKTQKEVTTLLKTWHIAYHGTREQDIKPTLEGGILLFPGDIGKRTKGRLRCSYQEKCRRFKQSLQLSDGFFDSDNDRCFCTKCLGKIRLYQKRGTPAKDYGLPVGWCRIGFKMEPRACSLRVKTEWHVAFHGTRKASVKSILECGELLMPGDVCLGGKQLSETGGHFNDKWKPTGFDTKQIFVSPSVRYAGHECYAESTRFKDRETGENFNAKVVFQLYIKPGSYQVGPQTIGATTEIDPRLSNQEIEWSTKERGAIIFYGLLVKLEETD